MDKRGDMNDGSKRQYEFQTLDSTCALALIQRGEKLMHNTCVYWRATDNDQCSLSSESIKSGTRR